MTPWLRKLAAHLPRRASRRRLDPDDELADEMQLHLELRQQALVDRGMDPEAARREARRQFGNVAALRERARDERSLPGLTSFLQDLRFGARILARQPAHAAAVVATIALGAGLNGGLCLIVNAIFLRPPAIENSRDFIRLDDGRPGSGLTYPDYADYRDGAAGSVSLVAFSGQRLGARVSADPGETPHRVSAIAVSGNYFDVLGAQPLVGRGFTGRDDMPPHGTPVVVLGEAYWERRYRRDPRIVGKTIELNLQPFTIVGVMPASFRGIDQPGSAPYLERVWMPLWTIPLVNRGDTRLSTRSAWWGLHVVGRLGPGVPLSAARAQIERVADGLDRAYPGQRPKRTPAVAALTAPDLRIFADETGLVVAAFGVATLLILLIAAANVAGLLLARAHSRSREVALRLSLGASRMRIVRQFLTESLILAVAGVGLGFVLSYWTLQLLTAATSTPPIVMSFAPDARVAVYGLALALVVTLATGVAPALQASRSALVPSLTGAGGGRRRLRAAFVGAEVAVCVLFLVLTALLLRAADQAAAVDPIVPVANLLVLSEDDGAQLGYDGPRRPALRSALQRQAETVPGVSGVALTSIVPFSGNRHGTISRAADDSAGAGVHTFLSAVSPSFFTVADVPIVAGRTFAQGAANEVVVNEALAARLWPAASPLGQHLATGEFDRQSHVVVGIVGDTPFLSLRDRHQPFLFLPLRPDEAGVLLARTSTPAATVVRAARAALQHVDSRLTLSVYALEDSVSEELAAAHARSLAGAAVGGLALLLSSVGIWGMASHAVVQRTREIGVRMALGASAGSAVTMLVRDTLVPVSIGGAIGIAVAVGVGRLLESLLYGLRPFDPLAFAGSLIVLVVTATAAAALPSRRAAGVDPLVALRSE